MAAILGINTDRVISLVLSLAAMAGLAGVLVTMNYGTLISISVLSSASKPLLPPCWGSARYRRDARRFTAGVAEAQFAGLVNSDYKDVFPSRCWWRSLFSARKAAGRPMVAKV